MSTTAAPNAAARIEISAATDALIIVDMQKDFLLPGAPLLVSGGAALLPGINALSSRLPFRYQVATQDWHPANHCSFKASGKGGVWPVHCVQGSPGAELDDALMQHRVNAVVRKGVTHGADSYSAFLDDNGTSTGLAGQLQTVGVRRVFVCGVASDFCVFFTAMDARKSGFEVALVQDLTAAVYADSWPEKAAALTAAGVTLVQSADLTGDGVVTSRVAPAKHAPSSSPVPSSTYSTSRL